MAKGAEVLAGGRARPDLGPYFYEPTLLAGVNDEMDLCRAETFGPVAAVYRCASVDEMVARANDSEYGLNASVWTRDVKAGRDVAARLAGRHGERQRGLRRDVGLGGADGRLEAVRARAPPRPPRPAQVHGVADGRRAARRSTSAPRRS